jgi:hypothetical protein
MANSITLPVQYLQALDLMYKRGALTSVLDNAEAQMVGKEFKIKKVTVQGPGAMTRGGAYKSGDVTVAWQSVTPDYDRGRKFVIDALDEMEVGGLYMDAAAEYERVWSIPEIDAYRFAKYAVAKGAGAEASLTASTAIAAINTGMGTMDSNEVPTEGRVLFIESSLYRAIQTLDTTKSRETLKDFAQIIPVPQSRFYTAITMYDGETSGQEAGGYIKNASTGLNINFMIVHPTAITQAVKRTTTPVDAPDSDYDAYRVSNRKYGYCAAKSNKTKGIYLHNVAAA